MSKFSGYTRRTIGRKQWRRDLPLDINSNYFQVELINYNVTLSVLLFIILTFVFVICIYFKKTLINLTSLYHDGSNNIIFSS